MKQASSSKNIVERKEAVDAEIKEVKAKLDSMKKELDAVYEKLGAEKEAAPKKKEEGSYWPPYKEAIVKLLSTLQAKRALTAKEAEEVAALL